VPTRAQREAIRREDQRRYLESLRSATEKECGAGVKYDDLTPQEQSQIRQKATQSGVVTHYNGVGSSKSSPAYERVTSGGKTNRHATLHTGER
jgi:hypothetical protein